LTVRPSRPGPPAVQRDKRLCVENGLEENRIQIKENKLW
jgi:hypothetical protein